MFCICCSGSFCKKSLGFIIIIICAVEYFFSLSILLQNVFRVDLALFSITVRILNFYFIIVVLSRVHLMLCITQLRGGGQPTFNVSIFLLVRIQDAIAYDRLACCTLHTVAKLQILSFVNLIGAV